MNIPSANNQLLNFTNAAAAKVRSLIEEESNFNLNLRVFITGGGCSGFQYGFTFDEKINDDDMIVEKQVASQQVQAALNDHASKEDEDDEEDDEGGGEDEEDDEGGGEGEGGQTGMLVTVKLLIDALSFQYLKGATIDYRQDVSGEHFVINNPNAKTTCGCGQSFAA